jgi:flagellar biosynthesis chaperone FliJ
VTTPYAALLSVRQIEEQQAEVMLAQALRGVAVVRTVVEQIRGARRAWLADGTDAGLAQTVSALELAERDAEARLAEAERRATVAREGLLDRQRQRQVVEKLHMAALAATARQRARRLQAELDELGGRSIGAFSERPQ